MLFFYNEDGNEIERNNYNPNGGLYVKYISTYDVSGNKTQTNGYNSDNSLEDKRIYVYDTGGNITEEIWYNSEGRLEDKSTYNYQYDKCDNWIEIIKFVDDKPFEITEREITYYE